MWQFKVFLIFLCVFLLLFGIFAVSNLRLEWGDTLKGYSALISGGIGIILLFIMKPNQTI